MSNGKNQVLLEETAVIKHAEEVLKKYEGLDGDLIQEYVSLVGDYKKLLKVSKKTNRISDLLTAMLQKREDEIKKVNAELNRLEEARKQLISEISHEMGSPMIAIQNYLKAILDGKVESSEKSLKMIYERILMVNHLIQDLFDLSILETKQSKVIKKNVQLNELLGSWIQEYKFEVNNQGYHFNIKSAVTKEEERYVVKVDEIRIKQVLTNLIYNAIKYTPQGGEIEINSFIRNGINDIHELIIQVSDNGVGIDEMSIPYIFERFFRVDEDNANVGTGLGLAIAKEIIEHHNGQIGVTSKLNEGSTFFFTLPIHKTM
ncbi:sensor histidine kinase [Bacillus sp. Marseille-P3661]|uniref:sensor histidine kinase n=1 Tax=Bacillus sp. Marseille-P3661 TaxID=1936234 RepID=UPI000C85997E|nr:HAMP domain-containing sensor histidine kinase [Bacillus sp. Marseille-P3661]